MPQRLEKVRLRKGGPSGWQILTVNSHSKPAESGGWARTTENPLSYIFTSFIQQGERHWKECWIEDWVLKYQKSSCSESRSFFYLSSVFSSCSTCVFCIKQNNAQRKICRHRSNASTLNAPSCSPVFSRTRTSSPASQVRPPFVSGSSPTISYSLYPYQKCPTAMHWCVDASLDLGFSQSLSSNSSPRARCSCCRSNSCWSRLNYPYSLLRIQQESRKYVGLRVRLRRGHFVGRCSDNSRRVKETWRLRTQVISGSQGMRILYLRTLLLLKGSMLDVGEEPP